jgi:hypothetical protein
VTNGVFAEGIKGGTGFSKYNDLKRKTELYEVKFIAAVFLIAVTRSYLVLA